MASSPPTETDDQGPEVGRVKHRRWRRLRARLRLFRIRMHSHPVLHWTWRTVVVLVASILLLMGIVMWFTPGPGWAAVILALAVLASEFVWARGLLRRAKLYAHRLKEQGLERQRRWQRQRRRKWEQRQESSP